MTTIDTAPSTTNLTDMVSRPGRTATALTVRQVRRGAALVAVLAAAMSALVAGTHASTVSSPAQAEALAALAGNPAIRTLFGEPTDLADPGGFTVWRTGIFLAVLIGAWTLLATTRITRGEEDAGRVDLLLSGPLTARHLLRRQLVVLLTAAAIAGAAATVALLVAGTDPAGAVVHGSGLALIGMFFAGTGALTAQVFTARSAATGGAVAVLAVGLMLRMVGDGAPQLGWVRWLTPFGLTGLSRPYDTNRWLPLLVLAAATAAVTVAAVLAGRRDVRGGWVTPAAGRPPRFALLGSVPAFALRRMLRPLAGWATGIGAYFLLIGLIAESMITFLADNPHFADLAARAGFAGLDAVEGYAATLFALLALPVSGFATARITALHADETGRRWTLLCAGPRTRRSAAGAEVLITTAGSVALTLVAGAAVAAGAVVSGAPLSLTEALAGALNVLPVALLGLGAAVLALGVAPQFIGWIAALPTVGGFLLLILADSIDAPAWIAKLSPFAHLARVPAEGPQVTAAAIMLLLGGIGCVVGLATYGRRDLAT
ncbi:ABC transporter permease [Actinoplanes solisilvae]|uniref:ABC transporter permease n=1 Tax=Actinoplanes solisilvae TaxID=2486853 RepID=UPI000FDC1547|nr:polyketide antibiotic transporter [Actinoplanes solisilvae]